MILGCALVYPRPLSSAPPGTELFGLEGGFLDAAAPFVVVEDGPVPDFALDVEGVCGSDSGWDLPAVFEDCVGLPAPSMEIDGGAWGGAAFGVEGTVATERIESGVCSECWGWMWTDRRRVRKLRRQEEQIMLGDPVVETEN